jgi:predicted small secreted protein
MRVRLFRGREIMMKKWMAFILICCVILLAGCNTVQGVGKDVEKAGEAIQKSTR